MREMTVFGVSLDIERGMPVVLLRDAANTFLPIWVGQPEAVAIVAFIQGVTPDRPHTYDVAARALDGLGARLESVAVVSVSENTFYAQLNLAKDGASLEVDSRPSDAISLALRMGAPIYVAEEVLEEAGVRLGEQDADQTVAEFRDFLEHVSPEDFGRH